MNTSSTPGGQDSGVCTTLSRAIIVSRDAVLDTSRMQHLALLFEKIATWPVMRRELSAEEAARADMEAAFLSSAGVVVRCGTRVPPMTGLPFGHIAKNADILFDFHFIGSAGPELPGEHFADTLIRHAASHVSFGHAPVVGDNFAPHPEAKRGLSEQALQLTLRRLPVPPDGMPWQDFIQFRAESETQHHLRRLRLWLQKQARAASSPLEIEEELTCLLHEYEQYMKLQHRKFGEGILSTLLVGATDAVASLLNVKLGDTLKSLIDIRGRSTALSEAELLAPGREIAYIAHVLKNGPLTQ